MPRQRRLKETGWVCATSHSHRGFGLVRIGQTSKLRRPLGRQRPSRARETIKPEDRGRSMSSNPYAAPRAAVSDVEGAQENQEIRLWSSGWRIGRLRYLAYGTGSMLLAGVVAGLVGTVLSRSLGIIVAILLYVAAPVYSIITAIKRSHDMNWSGWVEPLAHADSAGRPCMGIQVGNRGNEQLRATRRRPTPRESRYWDSCCQSCSSSACWRRSPSRRTSTTRNARRDTNSRSRQASVPSGT